MAEDDPEDPPRTPDGVDDDPRITDDDILWRRVPPLWIVKGDDGVGQRASKAAFSDDKEGPMSVAVARVAGTTEGILRGHEEFRVACFRAREARAKGMKLRFEPGDYEGHAVVVGQKKDSVRNHLRKKSWWYGDPEPAAAAPAAEDSSEE